MNINSIGNNYGIYNLYNAMFQNNAALKNNKFYQSLFPNSGAQNQKSIGENALQYVNNLKSASKSLGSSLNALSGSAFSNKTVTSSDNDVLSVKFYGVSANTVKPMTVKVEQTASGQVNEGKSMDSGESFGSVGLNRFSIEAGGKTVQLSVDIKAGDTNKDVQQKMANAINSSGAGVKATVETDDKNKTSSLKIEAAGTGNDPKNKFTISDVSGDLVSKTGAGDVKQEAQNAVYSINGGAARASASNTVDLAFGLSVTFNKASDKEVTIAPGKDDSYAKSAVESFVKSYNDLYSAAAENVSDPKAQSLASRLVNTSKIYSSSLSNIGINFDKDGRMTIDSKQLDSAAESGKLQAFFTQNSGKNYGFTNQLSNLANNVSRNTSNYVSSSILGNSLMDNFSYSANGKTSPFNFFNSGWLFDYLF